MADDYLPEETDEKPMKEGPSPDDVVAADAQGAEDAAMAQIGPPPKPANLIQVGAITGLIDALNAASGALFKGNVQELRWSPPGMPATKEPLPPDVWARLAIFGGMLGELAGMPGGDVVGGYGFEAEAAATTQAAMVDATGKLNQLARDDKAKAFIDETALKMERGDAGPDAPPAPPPP